MIPKRIIQVYENNNLPMLYKISQEIIKEKCPTYEYILYNNRTRHEFINLYYPQYIDLYDSLLDVNKNMLFVLLELHKNGGIYLDMDVILHKSFDELLDKKCCIMPLSCNDTLDKYCICSNANNLFIFYLILQISNKYNNNTNFISKKILFELYEKYKENNNHKEHIIIIFSDYNDCFGNFLYNVKINSGINKYPDWFKNNIYESYTKNKVKHTLLSDIKWLDDITYKFH